MLEGKKIILAVTGSIAAYKACILLRLLQQAGAVVRIAMTDAAAKFVSPLTFSTLSQNYVMSYLWTESEGKQDWSQHVQWAEWADLMIIAPATLNTLGKCSSGICNDSVSALFFSAKSPILMAPAMDKEMFAHPITQKNIQNLQNIGVSFVWGEAGYLASGLMGEGRMAEPEIILEYTKQHLTQPLLKGKSVLINAGPTRENIDPVRFISNHSTGKMGFALAQAAFYMGAQVHLVMGPTNITIPSYIPCTQVETADEMAQVMFEYFPKADYCVCSAAVADFKPTVTQTEKIKKQAHDENLTLALTHNIDILKILGERKKEQILIGFALESYNEVYFAQEKLKKKKADGIVLNSIRTEGAAFGHETNQVDLFWKDQTQKKLPLQSKINTALEIWEWIVEKEK